MIKYLKVILPLIFLSSPVQAEDNFDFKCAVDILDTNMNRLFHDIWEIKDSKPNDNMYHHLVYKEHTNKMGLEFYEKVHVFYEPKDPIHLYLKADIQFDYKNALMKQSDRKNYMFKDKIRIGNRKNYSNGTTILSINCAKF